MLQTTSSKQKVTPAVPTCAVEALDGAARQLKALVDPPARSPVRLVVPTARPPEALVVLPDRPMPAGSVRPAYPWWICPTEVPGAAADVATATAWGPRRHRLE